MNCVSVAWVVLAKAIPLRRFLSQSFGGSLHVREGVSLVLIVCLVGIKLEECPVRCGIGISVYSPFRE